MEVGPKHQFLADTAILDCTKQKVGHILTPLLATCQISKLGTLPAYWSKKNYPWIMNCGTWYSVLSNTKIIALPTS